MLKSQVPIGRRSVEQLLLRRPEFPAALWADSKAPLAFARKLTGVIKHEFDWPNNYFVPGDPVCLVALPRFADEFPTEMLRLAIQEQLGVQIDATRIRDLWINSSLARLAEILYDLAEKQQR